MRNKIHIYFASLLMVFSFFNCKFANANTLDYIILQDRNAGMFSMFSDVLALLNHYEKGEIAGFEVDYGEEGLYYEPSHGSNWWTYYCEPLVVGTKNHIVRFPGDEISININRKFWKGRKEANSIIKKYIRFKPYILDQVEAFRKDNFNDFYMIGVHCRGTDGEAEGEPSFSMFIDEVKEQIDSLGNTNYKIFIATDEQPFIELMEKQFPNKICYQTNAFRSKDKMPLHYSSSYSKYKHGEEALIDCLLFSKCNRLLVSYSNLSLWAALLNPHAPVVDVGGKLTGYLK